MPANPSFTAFDPDLKNSETQQWNLTIERQIVGDTGVRVSYLANKFGHTWRAYDINQQREFGPGPVQPRRPYQPFSSILYYDSGGSYVSTPCNSGRLRDTPTGLLPGGIQFTRAIGEDLYTGPQDIRNFRADRGDISSLARHILKVNYLYELPFGKGKPFLDAGGAMDNLIGGWQIAGITSAL